MATEEQTSPEQDHKDFFISYTSVDRPWAEWIAWQLEEMGYRSVLQAWDFHAGGNFVLEMDSATKQAERTIAVLSPEYFASTFTPSEWAAAFRRDPKGEQGLLIPVRVRPCDVEGLLGQLVSVDLVDRTEQEARALLQAEAQRRRRKPLHAPTFPFHPSIPRPDYFPGALRPLLGRRKSEARSSFHPATHADPDWERMLRRLRRSYKELLDQSLHGITWMELGLSTRPDMVSNVTNLLFRLPQGGERLLVPGTRVLDAFDEAEGELLILGAPGAGKSTLLLDLAQQLVDRALVDPGSPLPVILRLSSWALRRPTLDEWMVEQLSRTYDVPHLPSERWVKQGRLLPLLDGLDEMEEATRPACIAAINGYHHAHLTSLVVCSRQAEYEAAMSKQRLVLQNAVIVQPLSEKQIEEYLSVAGPSFAGVRMALHQSSTLQRLATTPLMLSVLLLTYRGVTAEKIIQQDAELEQQVWTDYVARQVAEKGNNVRYPLERTRTWLIFLAQQMRAHQQITFSAEYLQIDWLAFDQQRLAIWLATRLPAMIIGGCVGLLISLLVPSAGNSLSLLQLGLLSGFIGDSVSQQMIAGPPGMIRRFSYTRRIHMLSAMLLGLLLAASCGLNLSSLHPSLSSPVAYTFIDWGRDSCLLGLGGGLSFWIFQGLLYRRGENAGRKTSVHLYGQRGLVAGLIAWVRPSIWQAAIVLGTGIGLSAGLSAGSRNALINGVNFRQPIDLFNLFSGIASGLATWLSTWLSVSIIVVLVYVILAGAVGSLHFAERIHWTWRELMRTRHLQISASITGASFLFFGLISSLSAGLDMVLRAELSTVLNVMLNGVLMNGLSAGLIYWLLVGLYQGMKQEHLEDQDRQRFNQGIHRSLRNGLFLGLISAVIISTIGVLNAVLYDGLLFMLSSQLHTMLSVLINNQGLIGGLGLGLNAGLHVAWILLLAGMVIIWAFSGGLTVLRHYIIRWQLARQHTFPWCVQAFLDDTTTRILLRRVGGGYSFIHRRLQDYFADIDISQAEK